MCENPMKLTTEFVTAARLAEIMKNPNLLLVDVRSMEYSKGTMYVVQHRPRSQTIQANR